LLTARLFAANDATSVAFAQVANTYKPPAGQACGAACGGVQTQMSFSRKLVTGDKRDQVRVHKEPGCKFLT